MSPKTGDIAVFNYSGENTTDPNPLVIFLYADTSPIKRCHALTIKKLNQLQIIGLLRMFKEQDIWLGEYLIHYIQNPNATWDLFKLVKKVKISDPVTFYPTEVKPMLAKIPPPVNPYRTYYPRHMSGYKVITLYEALKMKDIV
jgi:hypothetical protein